MKAPHKHAELIKAWADGEEIQELVISRYTLGKMFLSESTWVDTKNPKWNEEWRYRIKPVPDVVVLTYIDMNDGVHLRQSNAMPANVRFVFDGRTKEIKESKVIK